jgi:hypothetical protein
MNNNLRILSPYSTKQNDKQTTSEIICDDTRDRDGHILTHTHTHTHHLQTHNYISSKDATFK